MSGLHRYYKVTAATVILLMLIIAIKYPNITGPLVADLATWFLRELVWGITVILSKFVDGSFISIQ